MVWINLQPRKMKLIFFLDVKIHLRKKIGVYVICIGYQLCSTVTRFHIILLSQWLTSNRHYCKNAKFTTSNFHEFEVPGIFTTCNLHKEYQASWFWLKITWVVAKLWFNNIWQVESSFIHLRQKLINSQTCILWDVITRGVINSVLAISNSHLEILQD